MDLFVIGLGAFAIFLAFQTIKIVLQQNAWVVERLGKYHATLEPGLNIVSRSWIASLTNIALLNFRLILPRRFASPETIRRCKWMVCCIIR